LLNISYFKQTIKNTGMRFYLVDRIEEVEVGKKIRGVKCWTLSDEIFNEHFPGFPVVPGVLLIESMAQLLGILIEKSFLQEYPETGKAYPVLSVVHKAKFRSFVVPGDKCVLAGSLKALDFNRGTGTATVTVDGELMAEADLSFIILHQKDLPHNDFIHRREEYLQVLSLTRTPKPVSS
jgi:3-hydroxyacyl-[acyl-carrier-protein] dehydratase